MPSFTLHIAFTSEQLQSLYDTETHLVIAKPNSGHRPNVAWQVIRPLENNVIHWEEKYGLFASMSDIRNGSVLHQFAATPMNAETGKAYTLESNAYISGPTGQVASESYCISNRFIERPYITAGLFQSADVNGQEIHNNAVCAVPVMLSRMAMMPPSPEIYIWMQSQVISNSVVIAITSNMTQLRFGGNVTEMSVAYDSNWDSFTLKGKLQAESLVQLMPAL